MEGIVSPDGIVSLDGRTGRQSSLFGPRPKNNRKWNIIKAKYLKLIIISGIFFY